MVLGRFWELAILADRLRNDTCILARLNALVYSAFTDVGQCWDAASARARIGAAVLRNQKTRPGQGGSDDEREVAETRGFEPLIPLRV